MADTREKKKHDGTEPVRLKREHLIALEYPHQQGLVVPYSTNIFRVASIVIVSPQTVFCHGSGESDDDGRYLHGGASEIAEARTLSDSSPCPSGHTKSHWETLNEFLVCFCWAQAFSRPPLTVKPIHAPTGHTQTLKQMCGPFGITLIAAEATTRQQQ